MIILCSLGLYLNLQKTNSEGLSDPIGKMENTHEIVQRKYDNELAWNEMGPEEVLRNRDTVRTFDASSANIVLNDGTKVVLGQNTMIVLDFSEKSVAINFAYGELSAEREGGDKTANLEIKSGNTTVSVKDGGLKVDKSSSQELTVKVEKGNADVKIGQQVTSVEKDQVANLSKDTIEVKTIPFKILSPKDYSIFYSQNVKFNWEGEGVSYLETSLDKSFKEFDRIEVTGNEHTKNFSNGNYFYRVSSRSGEKSEVRNFKIQVLEPSKWIQPQNAQTYNYKSDLPAITFLWTKGNLVSNYEINIFKSNGDKVFSSTTSSNSLFLNNLEKGKYYANITSNFNTTELKPMLSENINFSIEQRDLPSPVRLQSPDNDIYYPELIASKSIKFYWDENPEFDYYKIQISKSNQFTSFVLTKDLQNLNSYTVPMEMGEGTFYWRVVGLSGKREVISGIHSFQIKPSVKFSILKPQSGAHFDYENKDDVIMEWQNTGFPGIYLIEITNKQTNQLAWKAETSSIRDEISFPGEGRFAVTVKLLTKDKKEIFKTEPILVDIDSKIKPPEIIYPTLNSKINIGDKSNIVFQWKPSNNIRYYEFNLYDRNGIVDKNIYSAKIKDNFINFSDFKILQEGRFRAEVITNYTTSKGEPRELSPVNSDFYVILPKLKIPQIITTGEVYGD
jgi:hypothetical protein